MSDSSSTSINMLLPLNSSELDIEYLQINDFVLAKFATKQTHVYYVGVIAEVQQEDINISYLIKKRWTF